MVGRRVWTVCCAVASSAAILSCADERVVGAGQAHVVVLPSHIPGHVPPPRPFVSIIDSVALLVQPLDNQPPFRHGQRLIPTDTIINLPIGDFRGRATFQATILSNNGTTLHSAQTTTDVSGPGSVVELVLTPMAPVMLATPDTLRVPASTAVALSDSLRIYNRGVGPMTYRLSNTQPPFTPRTCQINCQVVRPSDTSGVVDPGQFRFFRIDGIRQNAPAVTYTLSTTQGDVRVVVRRP